MSLRNSISDYNQIFGQTYLPNQSVEKIDLYNKANWDKIRSSLLHVLEVYFELNSSSIRSMEENWNYFHSHCLKL